MADVFVSYAREDRGQAAALAHALEARGWTVWWDRDIVPGQAFDQAIEAELMRAGSVVVLWSARSAASEWVRNEAAAAAERGVLVPARIEAVPPPLEFRRRQAADLTGWRGDPAHEGFQALCAGIAAVLRAPVPPRPRPSAPRPAQPAGHRWRPWAAATGAIAAGFALYSLAPWRVAGPAPAPGTPTPPGPTQTAAPATPPPPAPRPAELADLVAGRYFGNVIADSRGPSRSDITVTITKLDPRTVRVTSDYPRLGSTDIPLTRNGNSILNAGGDTPFIVDLGQQPPTLTFDPGSSVAYRGTRVD